MCSLSTECSKLKKIQKANWRSHNGLRPISRVNFLLLTRMASKYNFGKEMHVHTADMQSPPVMHRDQRDFCDTVIVSQLLCANTSAEPAWVTVSKSSFTAPSTMTNPALQPPLYIPGSFSTQMVQSLDERAGFVNP